MRLLIFLISITATSCMSTIMDDEYSVIDPKLKVYIKSFKHEAALKGIVIDDSRLKLTFGNTRSGISATTDHSLCSVTVDSTTANWRKAPEEMLYHEFGHLFLNRRHYDEKPSLMATKGIRYKGDRQYYIDELFR